jgi:hypothetical protein
MRRVSRTRLEEEPAALAAEGRAPAQAVATVAAGLAAIGLGHALQVNNGFLHPQALAWLTVAIPLAFAAALSPRLRLPPHAIGQAVLWVMITGLAVQAFQLATAVPGIYLLASDAAALAPFRVGIGVALVLALVALLPRHARATEITTPLLLLTFFLLGLWMLRSAPQPLIDVWRIERDSAAALLDGRNPYSMTFPGSYGPPTSYGSGYWVAGRLNFGYLYPPLGLLLTLPGHLLGGDVRYAHLVAMTLSGLFIAYARGGRLGTAAAALLLFTPRSFFMLEQGWTESFVVLMLAAVVFCACRAPRALPYAFGLLLVSKQYMLLAAPLGWLLLPRPLPPRRQIAGAIGRAAAVGALVTVPLVLWDVPSFLRDVVLQQFVLPFRPDSLSYLAWHASHGGALRSAAPGFVAGLLAMALGVWKAPRTPAGFAAAVGAVLLVFFALNARAFCNYYYVVVGALCCTIGTSTELPELG